MIAIFNFFFINECVTNEPQGTSAGRLAFYWDNQREALRRREVNGYAESTDN